jgi:hypothetical protein
MMRKATRGLRLVPPPSSSTILVGTHLPHVHTLRSPADCQAIIEGAQMAKRLSQ